MTKSTSHEHQDQPTPALPTPAQLGYRMPAEFEPQSRVWVTTPTNPDTWPGCLERAQQQHAHWCDAMRKVVEVVATQDAIADPALHPEDAWVRDYGPVFLINDQGELACNDFIFNSWGEKYPPWQNMNATPQNLHAFIEKTHGQPVQRFAHNVVLEGGSFGVNGQGTVLTTEACLLHPNRNPQLTQRDIEHFLADTLGITHTIWMPHGLQADDTDGHQDDLAQWLDKTTLAVVRAPKNHHDHEALEANWKALQNARDQDGNQLALAPLPVVDPPLYYRFPETNDQPGQLSDTPGGGAELVPASYANFLISNGHLFVPTFGRPTDATAIQALEQAAPHLHITPIRAEWLVVGLGALHCLSQQQPVTNVN